METSEQRRQALTTPATSQVSTVLNDIGNGMMIGTLPFVIGELYNNIQGKHVSPAASKGMLFTLVASCGLGAVYGLYEARQNKKYDEALNAELNHLRDDLEAQKAATTRWEEKLAAKESHGQHHDHQR